LFWKSADQKSAMKKILGFAALAEAGTGAILLAYPPLAVQALFGAEISGAGIIMSRIAGVALLGLGVACWPSKTGLQPLYGMLVYSTLATLYLIRLGIRGAPVGLLLWPAVVFHAVLVILLVRARFKEGKTPVA
jgi:hypothetical protein